MNATNLSRAMGMLVVGAGLVLAVSSCGTPVTAPRTSPPTGDSAAADFNLSSLNTQLRDAAAKDDLAEVQRLVASGADINAKSSAQESAYLLAASENAPATLEWLLHKGGELNDKDRFDGTALIRAAERGQARSVGLLIQHGIDLNHVNNLGWQAIHEAIWLGSDNDGHLDTVLALIGAGAELDRPSTPHQKTPHEMAKEKGHARQLAALAVASTPVDAAEATGALLAASRNGDTILAARALRAGARLEARDESNRTPLLLAATNDHLEVARLLIHLGASPNAVDNQRDTPWLVTGVTGSVEMGKIISWAHPDLAACNRYGGISVIPAAERGHVDYVRWVLANTDTDVNHVNDLGWTALLEAIVLGDGGQQYVDIVSLLLDAGADPAIADKDGLTPLQHAETRGFDDIVAVLKQRR